MTHAIDVLRQEHWSMSRLVHLMDKLQKEIRAARSPTCRCFVRSKTTCTVSPDQCHHPKEDLIYRRLGQLEPGLSEIGTDLEYE